MKISLRLAGYAVGLAALAVTGASAAPTIQLVGTFDYPGSGNQTRAQKINDKGDVAGIFVDGSTGASKGFIMRADGTFSAPIVDPNDTANLTEVRGINNSGTACGDYTNSSAAFEGFFYSNGNFRDYDPEPTFTLVLGINNAGDFCGSVIPSSTGVQSGYVNIGGNLTEFVVPGAAATLTYQLNSSNQAVGYYNDSLGASHGYYRDPSTGHTFGPIDPAGSTTTIIFGNNDHNTMVGRYVDAVGATHGMVFIPPSHFLVYDFPGATFTSFNGINRHQEIVGRYTDPSTGIDHGLLVQIVGGGTSPMIGMAKPNSPMKNWTDRAENHVPAY